MSTPWSKRYAQRTERMESSTIRELLKLTDRPGLISFAGGLPAPDLFPVERFEQACRETLSRSGPAALQYSATEGYRPLREMIVRHTSRYGIHVEVDNVMITSGSQQALDLIGKVLINPGDLLLTERPTYLGAIQAFRAYQAEFLSVPMDDEGLCTAEAESALQAGPKFMYILPNFQNPSGITLSLRRRQELIALSDKWGVPIVEDDPYGQLRFEGEHLPPLVKLDADFQGRGVVSYTGNVIYLSTFSKTLAPGLRLGWVVAPAEVIAKLVQAKQGTDLHTSTFAQMVAYEAASGGFLDEHVKRIRRAYLERRDAMLDAIAEFFPPEVKATKPEGGLFLWARLPDHVSTVELLPAALERMVAFVPGQPFYPDGGGLNTMRLNFSNAKPELIVEGIRRLGEVLYAALEPRGSNGHRHKIGAKREQETVSRKQKA